MSYFSNKRKGNAEDIARVLAESVQENLTDERDRENGIYLDTLPMYPIVTDHQFSGEGVKEIQNMVNEQYNAFNANWRLNVEKACEERRDLLSGRK